MVKKIQKKKGLDPKLVAILNFLVIFNLLAIPLYIMMYAGFSFGPLQELNAGMIASTLRFLGYDARLDGHTVSLMTDGEVQKIIVSWDSTGWKSMYAVAALIMATPLLGISKRMKSAAIGIAIIFFVNYLRVTTTIITAAKFGFTLFDIMHTVLWREGLILAVVGVWFAWIMIEKYKIGKIK